MSPSWERDELRASFKDRLFLLSVIAGTLALWPIAVLVRLLRGRPYLMR